MVKINNSFSFEKLSEKESNNLITKLELMYNCSLNELQGFYFYIASKGKVYISSINIDKQKIERVNSIGMYFGTFHDNNRFRLSLEGSRFIKPKKNYVIINENTLKSYLSAENLFKDEAEIIDYSQDCPFLIVVHNSENLGCISVKDNMLLNYLPKSRKLDFNKVY